MNAERWARVTALFDEACEQPVAGRDAWLRARCDDDETRRDVEAMLRAFDEDPAFLEQAIGVSDVVADAVAGAYAGQRFGAYRLVAEIGRGGMGAVYEARRDDQEFDRRAAIKILPAWSGAGMAERFRLERQVLAGLDHPGIARLLDAGTTAEGVPYFVMELVDGAPIDAWCRTQAPRLRDRTRLVERVCDALAHAHQHLVIHRDVKPANILVTKDAQPKLLDFGIAALADADGEARGLTRTGHHSFTPEYASPEQVRGERVTTASDVYSIGVLLYLLLAGRPPYPLTGLSPLDAMRTVCEADPPLMSAVADPSARAGLRGDLDAIVMKCLAKAPADRYGTVAALAADLRAWRDGRPVSAAPQSTAYLARRFMRRHRGAVAAAAALTLAILGGAAATAWQARAAQQERDKAQNRFRQVQEFSRSLLFDVHDALRAVPGATEARRTLLDRAMQFLDGLAADAGEGDDELWSEVARGYRRLGSVQGVRSTENVGDSAGAAATLAKGVALAERALAARPESLDRLHLAIGLYEDLMGVEGDLGRREAADRAFARHLALLQELERRHAGNPEAMLNLANGYSSAGTFHARDRDYQATRRYYGHAVRIYESVPAASRATDDHIRDYSLVLKQLGAAEMVAGALDDSERHYRAALALEEDLIRRSPGNTRWPFEQSYTLSDLATALTRRGRHDEAIALYGRALVARRALADADPKNVRAVSGVAALLHRMGNAQQGAKRYADAAASLREEAALLDGLIARSGALPQRLVDRGWAVTMLALALANLADAGGDQAAAHRREARAAFGRIRPEDMKTPAGTIDAEFQGYWDDLSKRLAAR